MEVSTLKKRVSRKRLLMLIGLPLIAIVVVVAVGMGRRREPTYFTAKIERGDVMSIVQATGSINAVTLVQVGSQVSGNVDKLYADFNSRVKKGQVIAQLEPSLFRARLQQASADVENARANLKALQANIDVQQADVASAKANVSKARAAANQAKLEFDRAQDLFKQGIVAAAQRDTAESNFEAADAALKGSEAQYNQSLARLRATTAQVEQGKAQVAQRSAAVDAAKVDLAHTTIYAPIDGTVVARNVDVGQTVAASLQAPTLFTIAQDLTKMLVYVKTDESDVGNVRVGSRATFKVDAFPKETFNGQVKEVRINPQTVQNVVTYDTVIEFTNPGQKLLPGMTAYVTIPVAISRDTLKIPNGALRFRPELSDEERRELLAKAGISDGARRGMAPGQGGSAGGQAPGAGGAPAAGESRREGGGGAMGGGSDADREARRARRQQQGGGGGGGGGGEATGQAREGGERRRGGGGGSGAAGQASEVLIIWKLDKDKKLSPVQVRTGITDFTYTQVIEVLKGGPLNEGEVVVTGMTNPNRQAPTSGGFGRSPVGSPGGSRGFGRR